MITAAWVFSQQYICDCSEQTTETGNRQHKRNPSCGIKCLLISPAVRLSAGVAIQTKGRLAWLGRNKACGVCEIVRKRVRKICRPLLLIYHSWPATCILAGKHLPLVHRTWGTVRNAGTADGLWNGGICARAWASWVSELQCAITVTDPLSTSTKQVL